MSQQRIGRYEILEDIAVGGQGAVYKAIDPLIDRIVAIKVLKPELTSDGGYLERFYREAAMTAQIDHPNVVKIHDMGEDDGRHFIVMEYLPRTLADLISRDKGLSIDRVLELGGQIAEGLAAAHACGITHRDVKPQNVLITQDGDAKVTDFGIARAEALSTMTATGMKMGTPHYMSPEQAQGNRADLRSDVYSLGCVMYQMLAGEVPFQGTTPMVVLRRHIDEEPRPIRELRRDVPRELTEVVERAMEKDPDDRYQSAGDFAEAINSVADDTGRQAQRARSAGRPTPARDAPRPGARQDELLQPEPAFASRTMPRSLRVSLAALGVMAVVAVVVAITLYVQSNGFTSSREFESPATPSAPAALSAPAAPIAPAPPAPAAPAAPAQEGPAPATIAAPIVSLQSTLNVNLQDPGGGGSYTFAPADFSFQQGQTVTFNLNAQTEFHTFTVDELGIDVSLDGGTTEQFTFTFDNPGTYSLICIPHETLGMVGTITVSEPPAVTASVAPATAAPAPLAPTATAAPATAVPAPAVANQAEQLSAAEVARIVEAAVIASPRVTEADRQAVVDGVLLDLEKAVAGQTEPLSAAEVVLIVNAAIMAIPAATPVPVLAVPVPSTPVPPPSPTPPPRRENTGLTFWSDLAAQCDQRGGHLRLGNRITEFANLNPPTINQVIQFSITAEVLSGLVQLDPQLRPVPDLAKSWSVSSDLQTYTFKLRENAKYHTGRQFTADDVVFTYDNQLDPATQSIHTKGLEGVNRPVKIDDFTVEISTAFPRASFLTKVVERASGRVMTIVDRETIAEVGQGGYNRMPVGVGPFRITDHFFGERLELEAARDTYYDPSVPCLDQVTMFNIPEDNTLIASLSTAQVDMIYGFAPQFWDQLEETRGVIVDATPDVGFQMLVFNKRADRAEKIGISSAPWDNQEIIYALGNGLDRQKYIDRAFKGGAIPAYTAINPGLKFYFRDLSGSSRRAFNLALAKVQMAENGFPDGFEVEVMTTPGNRVPLEVLGALLKESINVTLTPDIVENSVYQPRRAAGEWEAFIGGSGGDTDPDDAIDDWFVEGAKFNTYGYNDEVVNRLNLKQKASFDLDQRLDLILQISDRMDETFNGIFLHHNVQRIAYRDHVKGYVWIHALRQLGAVWLDY